ncbi:hypothetical protein ACLOJK_022931 [Asimina triloba]
MATDDGIQRRHVCPKQQVHRRPHACSHRSCQPHLAHASITNPSLPAALITSRPRATGSAVQIRCPQETHLTVQRPAMPEPISLASISTPAKLHAIQPFAPASATPSTHPAAHVQ